MQLSLSGSPCPLQPARGQAALCQRQAATSRGAAAAAAARHPQILLHTHLANFLPDLCLPQLFSTYDSPAAREAFGVNLAQLVDTLSVFASSSDAPLHMRYPGPNGELQLE